MLGKDIKVTKGNVSSLSGLDDDTMMMQISAPIQPGNSGGPLLDNSGNVVGVVSAKLNELAVAEATGSLSQNVNFAIKYQTVQVFLDTHDINYQSKQPGGAVNTADIVDQAREYTLQVQCFE